MNPFDQTTEKSTELQTAEVAKIGLNEQQAIALSSAFTEFEEQAKVWADKARELVVSDISQKAEMKQAREARLALRAIRIAVGKKHEELKEDAKKTGQFLDLIKRKLTGMIEPIESHLQLQEDFEKVHAEKLKKELFEKRFAELSQYVSNAEMFSLGEIDEEVYQNILTGQKLAAEQREKARIEAEQRAKDEAEAKAKEDERIRLENEELKRKQAEKDAEHKAERERMEKAAADQRAKDEAARKKSEDKLKAERAERKRLEDEAAERAAKEESEKREKAAAERKAKRAPDKDKLIRFADQLTATGLNGVTGTLVSDEANKILKWAQELINRTVKYITDNANSL